MALVGCLKIEYYPRRTEEADQLFVMPEASQTLCFQPPAVLSKAPILLTRLPPLTERVREISLSWMGWGSGNERSWTLTWQEETNNSGPAVNKKPQKTRDLNEKSRDSRLGFLCLPDWLSFEPILKGSPIRTLSAKSLSTWGFLTIYIAILYAFRVH
jgi:hypothetical protein